jgi:hypothetical protein
METSPPGISASLATSRTRSAHTRRIDWVSLRSAEMILAALGASPTRPVGQYGAPAVESVVLDTDVVSLTQKRRLPDPMRRTLERYELCITFVTLGELAKWGELHNWGIRRWTQLADWVGGVTILNADGDVTYRWGQLAAAAPVGVADPARSVLPAWDYPPRNKQILVDFDADGPAPAKRT